MSDSDSDLTKIADSDTDSEHSKISYSDTDFLT